MVVRVTGVVVLVNLLTAVTIADDLIDILVVTVIRMTSVVVVFSVRDAVVVVLRAHSGVDNTHWAGLPLVAEVNVDELGNTSASSPSAIPTYILARGIPPHTLSTETTAPRPLAVAVVFLQLALALHTGFLLRLQGRGDCLSVCREVRNEPLPPEEVHSTQISSRAINGI